MAKKMKFFLQIKQSADETTTELADNKNQVTSNQEHGSRTSNDNEKPKEKSGDIWNIMGFITAGITLLGAAFFYLVGWTYLSNWYAFFGVSMSQLSLPTQHVLVNSVTIIFFSLSWFLYSVTIDRILSSLQRRALIPRKNKYQENNFQENQEILLYSINLARVMIVYFILVIGYIAYNIISLYINGSIIRFSDIPEELIPFSVVIFSASLFFIFNFNAHAKETKHSNTIKLSIVITIVLFSIVSMAALDGIADAAGGNQGAWKIPQVYIFCEEMTPVLNGYEDACEINSPCWYGPFGLLSENEQTIYLIPPVINNENNSSHSPKIIILHKSEQIILDIHKP